MASHQPPTDGPEPLTPAQQAILEHTERKVAVLDKQNETILAKSHKLTGKRYAPKRLHPQTGGTRPTNDGRRAPGVTNGASPRH